MSSQSYRAQLAEIEKKISRYQSIEYRWHRNDDSYLYLEFADKRKIRLPVIDLRPYQEEVQEELWIKKKKRFFLVRPRRSGKEVESWNMLIQGAITEPGLYLMIYPTNVRARLVLWEGAITLPGGRSLRFLDMIPGSLIAGSPNNADMSIHFKNGSIIRVIGSDIDPDKLRGVNVRGAAFSEYAYSDPRVLHILMPVFRQNGGWFILQTTFNGQNHAYRFMQEIKDNPDWYCRVDSIETLVDSQGRRYVTDDMIEDDRRSGMPEFMIQQEYYSVIQLNQETLYFANELNYLYQSNRIMPELYIPEKRVRMHMDIGWNDKTACLLEQNDEIGNPVIISYTENNNKAFEYYVRWAESECNQQGLLLSEIYAPHDGQKHDFNTGKNTVDFGRDLGYNVYIAPKPTSKFNAIQSMRRMIPRAKFNKEKTRRLLECLSNYSKEFDTKRGIYKDEPLHNWASHGVECFQTMTLAYEAGMIKSMPRDIFYINA